MPPRRIVKDRVAVTRHLLERWEERTGAGSKNVGRLLTALLIEQLPAGLPARNGQAFLKVSADRFGLRQDVEVPLEFPNLNGVWVATTVLPGSA